MPKIKYQDFNLAPRTLAVIKAANEIIEEYIAKGFDLTLRQLYYQFVARDLIPNKQKEYDKLGVALNKGRLAGLVDWVAIVDRTRRLEDNTHWTSPGQIINACVRSFIVDRWADQRNRVEVWIEKDALTGVISGICKRMDVPYFSCRGYTSASSMWSGGVRMLGHVRCDQNVIIIHLGDHDPSGMDMTRDIAERLNLFTRAKGVEVKRIALNMDQIEELNPPPDPAKLTDSRAGGYVAEFGYDSWELDALEPEYIEALIRRTVLEYRDDEVWLTTLEREKAMVDTLKKLAEAHGE